MKPPFVHVYKIIVLPWQYVEKGIPLFGDDKLLHPGGMDLTRV
jgi:hypothetical protein